MKLNISYCISFCDDNIENIRLSIKFNSYEGFKDFCRKVKENIDIDNNFKYYDEDNIFCCFVIVGSMSFVLESDKKFGDDSVNSILGCLIRECS